MSFVDPYIDTETGLLINSIGAKTQSELDQIEADFVSIGLLKLYDEKFRVSYSLEDLQYPCFFIWQSISVGWTNQNC